MLRDRILFGRKASTFTLQWHLTNACEGECRHCYDRAPRDVMPLDAARRTFEDFQAFCLTRRVRGQVCLTGGNPLLYPGFFALYDTIAAAGVPISILGNPAPEAEIAAMAAIRKPAYYQVSLEGLPEHNDHIRGQGHFDRTLRFLDILREAGIRSVVMLTLTQDNLSQALPLAESLRGRADRFSFNRLSPVGNGAALPMPSREEYAAFLHRYLRATHRNPILGLKDNLFNIFRHHYGRPLLRGCTGFGCGAAFNFVALLPDGEVHACRKFPSPIGNIRTEGLGTIYASTAAGRYRRGPEECHRCPIRNRCGGCLAVAHGHGRDVFRQRDPHCFMAERHALLGASPRTSLHSPRRLVRRLLHGRPGAPADC
jgi:selenobiotic family peptide radical SAM maturase